MVGDCELQLEFVQQRHDTMMIITKAKRVPRKIIIVFELACSKDDVVVLSHGGVVLYQVVVVLGCGVVGL